MRQIRSLLIYFAVVFVGGALLAPQLLWLAEWAAAKWPALGGLAANPFHRFLARAWLGLALIGLPPLLRCNGMLAWSSVGLGKQGKPSVELVRGFCVGFASLACVAVLALAVHGRVFASWPTATRLIRGLVGSILVAAIVAVIEEFLFRGALFGILRKSIRWPWALVISSAVYSAAHFIQGSVEPATIHWYSGLSAALDIIRDAPPLVPAFFTLFAAGACLAMAYQRRRTLYFSMGLHAGWIFWVKSYKLVTQPAPGASVAIWGTDKLVDGWLAFAVLAAVFWWISKDCEIFHK